MTSMPDTGNSAHVGAFHRSEEETMKLRFRNAVAGLALIQNPVTTGVDREAPISQFIIINEGSGGEHIARTVYAASEDDARHTHQENYADEPIVAVHQSHHPGSSPPAACDITPSRLGGWRTRRTPTTASPGDASDCLVFAPGPIVVGHYRHQEDEEDEQHG